MNALSRHIIYLIEILFLAKMNSVSNCHALSLTMQSIQRLEVAVICRWSQDDGSSPQSLWGSRIPTVAPSMTESGSGSLSWASVLSTGTKWHVVPIILYETTFLTAFPWKKRKDSVKCAALMLEHCWVPPPENICKVISADLCWNVTINSL